MNANVCSFCRNSGKNGADWLLKISGEPDRRVHKPCGEKAVAHAPEGVRAAVAPSPELRAKWRAEREEREARTFWAEKFAQAKPLRNEQVNQLALASITECS